jgi:uncharacterized membrane protein YhaH (DUF805 family)
VEVSRGVLISYNFFSIGMLNNGTDLCIFLSLVSIPVALIFIVLPRVRDCDWPQWVGLFTVIPYVGNLSGIALLFARSKVIGRSDDPDSLASESTE